MTVLIDKVWALKSPLGINKPGCDLIISGIIRTDSPITLSVRNLIILGEVITTSTLTIHASEEVLNFGDVRAQTVYSQAFVDVLDARVIEKLAGLSVKVLQDNPVKLSYQP